MLRNTFSGSARKINLKTQGIAEILPSMKIFLKYMNSQIKKTGSASERNPDDDVHEEIQRYLARDPNSYSVADRQAIRSNCNSN